MVARILVIEDDPEIARVVSLQLGGEGFSVEVVEDGLRGLDRAMSTGFDIVVLDLNLPTLSGIEVCRELRKTRPNQPIIMLTARTEEIDRVLGLELGADDYVTKPFSGRELCARVRALLRRSKDRSGDAAAPRAPHRQVLDFKRLVIDLDQRLVWLDSKAVELTSTEFELLVFMANNPGTVFTREQLLSSVWGYSSRGYERTVNTLISRLRAKIEQDPENPFFVQTVWGVGYRFTPEGPEPS